METACALWLAVLAPQFPLIAEVTEFINVGSSGPRVYYRSLTRMRLADHWNIQGSKQRLVEHGAYSSTAVAPNIP